MKVEFLKVTSEDSILQVSLNRPEKRNAFHPGMIKEITQVFKQASKDKALRAILLTASGASFCSGGDLEWMKSMAEYSYQENLKDAKELFKMYQAIRECPLPVIGRVFGHCFGGGAGMVAVCDIVAAETETQFCFSEVKWGLAPAVISPFVVDRCGSSRVREWFITAKVFRSREAIEGGLVQFAGSQAEVDFYIEETLKMIRAAAPEAVKIAKNLHQSYSQISWKKIESVVTKLIATRRVSKEGQFGLSAFLEKRSPNWSELKDGSRKKV